MPGSGPAGLQQVFDEAVRKSAAYEWMEAADLYRQALDSLDFESNTPQKAEIMDLLANCFFKAAFQSKSRLEFKQRMQLSKVSCEEAEDLYERAGRSALSKRSEAKASFAASWLIDVSTDRRNLVEASISTIDEVAKILANIRDERGLATAHKELLTYLSESVYLASGDPRRAKQNVVGEQRAKALQIGETTIEEFGALADDQQLLECLSMTVEALLTHAQEEAPSPEEALKKAEQLVSQMVQVSEKIGTPYASSLANRAGGGMAFSHGDYAKAFSLFNAGILVAEETKDSLLLGSLLGGARWAAFWAGYSDEDVEKRREFFERGLAFGLRAIESLEVPLHGFLLDVAYGQYAECCTALANHAETERHQKVMRLRKAIEIAGKGRTYEDYNPGGFSAHALSKALYFLATMGVEPEEKAQLLNTALPIREEVVRETDLVIPRSWNSGVQRNLLALIKAELSNVNHDPEMKVELLRSSVLDMGQGVQICTEWGKNPGLIFPLALYHERYGDILVQLHSLTREVNASERAVKAYLDALEYVQKSGHIGPVGAIRWKIARVHDAIGDYQEASQVFKKSAEDYRIASNKLPGSASLFGEIASYMEAWSVIEEARLRHSEEQYSHAADNYARVATILQQTRSWSHLSGHYVACSFLEGGEALSRQENLDASIESFKTGVKTFRQAIAELERRTLQAEGSQEKEELTDWLGTTRNREKYCLARIDLEEAKVLDTQGEEEASGAKFRSASEFFRQLFEQADTEQARRELETLTIFCEAWAKMKAAETMASPDMYSEAENLFLKVEKVAPKKRFRLLALANAFMCRSLERGTRFRRTRDTQLYSEIKRQLEVAADCYSDAGFQKAASWTHATQRYFDALVYLVNAETELDSKRKTEFFHLAEKHLELAGRLYGEAGFPSKRDQVDRQLQRARQEKEVLLTPVEVLAENPALTGVAVAPVSLLRDRAVGLEQFESAKVVGTLRLSRKELHVGEDLTIDLEILNAGKTTAMLLQLENVVLEGLKLDQEGTGYRIRGSSIDMKGKRLEYLKSDEFKIPLRAVHKGVFELRPRIVFVDEKGNQGAYEFERAILTVRELGISGWIRGPG